VTSLRTFAMTTAALLISGAADRCAAQTAPAAVIVDLDNPLSPPPLLQGYLRRPNNPAPAPAVVLLHPCTGGWKRLDARWGERIASWGYVTLTIDSFGPRGMKRECGNAPVDLAGDAYRALNFLVRQPFVDAERVAAIGFSMGGWLTLLSVGRGPIERNAANKFRAAVAFYPPCLGFKDNMTVPTLILVGANDDWTLAQECRNMVDGRDDYGISRTKGDGVPMRLIVYPGAWHGFDVPLTAPVQLIGHRLEYNPAAADQAMHAVRNFLSETIGETVMTR
jgi:dienelactone hydrolase